MRGPRASLDQWHCFMAVVDEGSYARAAEALHKSQSAVTYAIQKLEEQLGVALFEIRGRKAELTDAGQVFYRRGRALLDEALRVEASAASVAGGWEPQLRIASDALFPQAALLDCLVTLAQECTDTRLECVETVLSGAEEALLEQRCDIAITGVVPPGFLADPLLRVRFIAVAHCDHPLHQLARELDYRDLRPYRQLVVRDSGSRRRRDSGWLDAAQRLTVSRIDMSVQAVCRGLGFAWLPEVMIREALAEGVLKALPLREGRERFAELFIVMPDRDVAGPAARRAEALIKAAAAGLSN
ncbi:LysR family transcriptional regulator [Spongiibacter sp.]|uniref:LysR family transcriptional regulator n=1 Tax=Spongiibacter sp. TaxID=2024860 RepID=UPI00356B0DE6